MSTNPKAVHLAECIAAAFPVTSPNEYRGTFQTVDTTHNIVTLEDPSGGLFIVTVEAVFTPSNTPLPNPNLGPCCPDCIERCTGYCSLCHNKADHDPACSHPDHPGACRYPQPDSCPDHDSNRLYCPACSVIRRSHYEGIAFNQITGGPK